jgi:uncharacterized protein
MLKAIAEAARFGVVPAQIVEAVCLWNGNGAAADRQRAIELCRQAASSGDAFAQYCFGLLLESISANGQSDQNEKVVGLLKPRDDAASFFAWYKRSAEQGFAPAQLAVSSCFRFGLGVQVDLSEARAWAQKAATAGFAPAQETLSVLYSEGIGGQMDRKAAFQWALTAAEHGHASAAFKVASFYETGKGIERDQAAALDWYLKSADGGHWLAHAKLTQAYRFGLLGLERDESKALEHQRMTESLDPARKYLDK